MGLRKLYILGDMFWIEAIFSLQKHILTYFHSKVCRSMSKADEEVGDVIFSTWFIGIVEILVGTIQGQA